MTDHAEVSFIAFCRAGVQSSRLEFAATNNSALESWMRKNKPLRVPVTQGLKDVYSMDMRTAYEAACMGCFSVILFGRLAVALAVVRTALELNKTRIPDALETLDAAIMTLVDVRKRGDETDIWELTEAERPAILDGIDMAEQCIGTLDVALLTRTADMLLLMGGEQPAQ